MLEKIKNPYVIIILTFVLTILVGSILLVLPCAVVDRSNSLSYVDALFTSTSAVCVTGLSVVGNVGATLSIFGKIVLAILIEIGGLSFLTIAIFIIILTGAKLGMTERFLMKEALNYDSLSGIGKLIKRIVGMSLIIQGVGIVVNLFVFLHLDYNFIDSLGLSTFHTISSFNNAGFDIFGTDASMSMFQTDAFLNITTIVLIVLGGIGFVTIYDVATKRSPKKYSLHTKVVLLMTFALIFGGAILYKITSDGTWLQSFFQSVSARTAGFATDDMSKLPSATTVLMIMLMFIGASPASTGGGIKTTTAFVLFATIISYATGKQTTAFKRKIPSQLIFKAFSLIIFSFILILAVCFTISAIEVDMPLTAIVFEVVSAFATVGLSMGITTKLSLVSKLIICVTMFVGRLGPLTLMSVWNKRWANATKENVSYPEEKIIIG